MDPESVGTIILMGGTFDGNKAEVLKLAGKFHDNYLFFDYDARRIEAYVQLDPEDVIYSHDAEVSDLLSEDYDSMVASFKGRVAPTPLAPINEGRGPT